MTVLARASVLLATDLAEFHAGLEEAEKSLQRSGERLSRLGSRLTMSVSLPIAAIGTASATAAATFDDSMRKMVALTGVSAEQMQAWRDDVRELAVEFGSTGDKAAEALFFITSAGIEGADAMEALEASLKATAIGLGETKTVADAATSAMNAYAATGLTANRATEILAAGIKFGKFEADQLAPVIGRLTGLASALNIPFADVVGTLAVFSRTGTDAAEGATQLSAIMSTLLGTSKEGEEVLNAAGLSLEALREVVQGPRGLINVMRILEEALGGSEAKLATVVPNIRALRGVLSALAQNGAVVNAVLDGTENSVGFLDQALQAVQGPMMQMRQAWARIKDAAIEVGEVLLPVIVPAITAVASALRDAAKAFGRLTPDTQNWVLVLVGLAAALGPVLSLLGGMLQTVALFKLSGLLASFTSLGAILGVGGPLVVGALAVGAAFLQMRLEIGRVQAEVRTANKLFDTLLGGMKPETAGKAALQLHDRIRKLETVAFNLKMKLRDTVAEANKLDPAFLFQGLERAGIMGKARGIAESIAEVNATIEQLEGHKLILMGVAGSAEAVTAALTETEPPLQKIPAWVGLANAAMEEFTKQLKSVETMELLLGDQFDVTEGRGRALADVVKALVEAGVPLDAVLGKNGQTLRVLAGELAKVQKLASATALAESLLTEALGNADAAVQSAMTPLQIYEQTIAALNTAVDLGKISWEQYVAAVKKAQEVMKAAETKTNDLGQALQEMTGRAVEDFVDFAFGAQRSFKEFVRSALADIAKLILKLQLMQLLFPKEGTGVFGKLLGFARGGFLPPGQVGMVGEQGPELITAGRMGVHVTPLSSPGGGGRGDASGMPPVIVHNHVTAIDAQGVSRFFEENEGLMAGSVMRALMRSSAMSRRFGGG